MTGLVVKITGIYNCEERYITLGVSLVLMRSAAIPQLLNGIDKEIASSVTQASDTGRSVSPPRNDAPVVTVIAGDVPEAINPNKIFTRPAAISSFGIIPDIRDGFVAVRHCEERYITLGVSLVLMRSAAIP